MKQRLPALLLPVAAVLALVALPFSLAGSASVAFALVALAVAVGLVGLHLRLGVLDEGLRAVARQGARRDRSQAAHVERLSRSVDRNADLVRRQVGRVRRDIQGTRKHLDMLPSDTAYLQRLIGTVADDRAPLPALGGWAATARSVLAILDEIQRAPGPVTVLDCGSGTSTVLEALVVRARGLGGHVFAVDADPDFAEETRSYLRAHGVEEYATVVDAPITDVQLPDGSVAPWYNPARLPATGPIDVLFVDGPVGTLAPEARFPAFPLLADRLAPGALVVLDDTNRPEEKAVVERWLAQGYAGRELELVRVHGRATLLRVKA